MCFWRLDLLYSIMTGGHPSLKDSTVAGSPHDLEGACVALD